MIEYLSTFSLPVAIIRMILALLCGGCLGIERSKRFKEAGIRTHCIIAITAAVLMMVSKYGFADLAKGVGAEALGSRGADAARIAAQVVSGISFLGAGVIFKTGNSVKGLTTAAGIWATAAIGLTIGAGMYIPGVALTIIIVLVQYFFHKYSIGKDAFKENEINVIAKGTEKFKEKINEYVNNNSIQLISMKIEKKEGNEIIYDIVLRAKNSIDFSNIEKMALEYDEIISINTNY